MRITCILLAALLAPALALAADSDGGGHRHHGGKTHDADSPSVLATGADLAAAGPATTDAAAAPPNIRKSTAGDGLAPFDSPGAALLYRVATALGAGGGEAAPPVGLPKPDLVDVAATAGAAVLG